MASRDLTSALETAIAADSVKPLIFTELGFSATTYYFWNGRETRSWNSQNWLGSGLLIRANDVSETQNSRSTGIAISLEGTGGALLSVVINQAEQNQTARIWIGAEDGAGAVIADPYLSFRGFLDSWEIDKSTENTMITLFYESHLATLDRVTGQRLTTETQQLYYPDDLGFQYMATVEAWSGYWGLPK